MSETRPVQAIDASGRIHVSEREAMELAEASREKEWTRPSFMREMFLGNFRLDLLHPFPLPDPPRPEFQAFYDTLKELLRTDGNPVEIDASGEYPPSLLDALRKLGAFGMKIPKEYGGLGFTNAEYQSVMELLGSWDGNVSALLSAHQSIGVPQPLKLFGSPELKKKYLPRCAKGDISAFALTEVEVGSDPARLTTNANLLRYGTTDRSWPDSYGRSPLSIFTCAAGLVEPRRRDSAAINVPPLNKARPFGGRFQTASQPKPSAARALMSASSFSTSGAASTRTSRAPPLFASRSTITHSLPLSPTEAITR